MPPHSFGQVNLPANGRVCCFFRKRCIARTEQCRYSIHSCFWRLEEKVVPVVFPFQSLQYSSVVTDGSVVLSLGRVHHLWPRGSRSKWRLYTFVAVSPGMLRKPYCYRQWQEHSLYKFVVVRNGCYFPAAVQASLSMTSRLEFGICMQQAAK